MPKKNNLTLWEKAPGLGKWLGGVPPIPTGQNKGVVKIRQTKLTFGVGWGKCALVFFFVREKIAPANVWDHTVRGRVWEKTRTWAKKNEGRETLGAWVFPGFEHLGGGKKKSGPCFFFWTGGGNNRTEGGANHSITIGEVLKVTEPPLGGNTTGWEMGDRKAFKKGGGKVPDTGQPIKVYPPENFGHIGPRTHGGCPQENFKIKGVGLLPVFVWHPNRPPREQCVHNGEKGEQICKLGPQKRPKMKGEKSTVAPKGYTEKSFQPDIKKPKWVWCFLREIKKKKK